MKKLWNVLRTVAKRLLTISGLAAPVNFCIGVVLQLTLPLIIYSIGTYTDPAQYHRFRAHFIRDTARKANMKIHPLLLAAREQCEYCPNFTFLFVMPDNVCWDCWQRQLAKYGIRIIEHCSGTSVKYSIALFKHKSTT